MNTPTTWLKHRPLALSLAADWHYPGADAEDVRQTAMIALWEASRCYLPDRGMSFPSFARLVIQRRLRDGLRAARAPGQMILSDSEREWDAPTSADETVVRREEIRAIVAAYHLLSPLEQKALTASTTGDPYESVGPFKSVDNAVQRARRKIREAVYA